MKKTLAAVAVLGAFAGSALAADVQLYGIVDEGLAYSHVDLDGAADATDSFSMNSGMQSGSRFGFKGTEDLGNGLTVGFVLENGFTADNGADNSTLFDREASLFIEGGFGKLAMGKIGSINCGTSSWAQIGVLSAFGTSNWGGYSNQIGSTASTGGVMDNTIAYQSPTFAGFTVFAQYSMGDDGDKTTISGSENESSLDRYYAIGAKYANGPLTAYFAVDSVNYRTWAGTAPVPGADDIDDSLTVTLGGNYDFGVAQVFFGAQYFDEVKTFGSLVGSDDLDNVFADKIKGYGLNLSANFPVAGGKIMAGLGFVDAEAADSQKEFDGDEFQRYIVSVGYDYPFSKRTDAYVVASYMQDSIDYKVATKPDVDPTAYTFVVGLRHKF